MTPEQATWASLHPGDRIEVRGKTWTVQTVAAGRITLRSGAGRTYTGRPDPAGAVTVLERNPEFAALDLLQRELKARPVCGHWILTRQDYCGADEAVHLYLVGHRCPQHAPGAIKAANPHPCGGCGNPVIPVIGQKCLTCGTPTTKERRQLA